MQLNGKRSYGKIASLPPEVRNAVDNMILTCTVRLPEIQAYIEEQAGVDVSTSTISRYGKRLSETYRDLTIAQENFEALRKELEKYPEQDSAEILTRIASHKMMAALVSKSDKDWNEMRADKLLKEISGLTRAMAYKQRVDIQNKDTGPCRRYAVTHRRHCTAVGQRQQHGTADSAQRHIFQCAYIHRTRAGHACR